MSVSALSPRPKFLGGYQPSSSQADSFRFSFLTRYLISQPISFYLKSLIAAFNDFCTRWRQLVTS